MHLVNLDLNSFFAQAKSPQQCIIYEVTLQLLQLVAKLLVSKNKVELIELLVFKAETCADLNTKVQFLNLFPLRRDEFRFCCFMYKNETKHKS